jgi:hypothetical protein
MDFLFIFISIAGAVFAGVMLLLASRTSRMERASDARVQELQSMATGSVLFVSEGLAESDDATEAPLPLMDEVVAPLRLQSNDDELDLAWDQMLDETVEQSQAAENIQPHDWTPDVQPPAHQFVLTVPVQAGAAPAFSFAPAQRTSRT